MQPSRIRCWEQRTICLQTTSARQNTSNGPCTGRRLPDGSTQLSTCLISAPHRYSTLPDRIGSLGNLDRAAGYAERTIEEAERSDHPIALCRAFILTMPFYFWIGHLGKVERDLSELELTAEKYSLEPFRAVATGLRGRHLIAWGRQRMEYGICKIVWRSYGFCDTKCL